MLRRIHEVAEKCNNNAMKTDMIEAHKFMLASRLFLFL